MDDRMERSTFDVWTRDPDNPALSEECLRGVEVEWRDQVTAEARARSYAITTDTPMALTELWAWCALVRTGATALKFRDWRDTVLVGIAKPKVAAEPVDPTLPAPPAGSP